jgi:hypothetical protein
MAEALTALKTNQAFGTSLAGDNLVISNGSTGPALAIEIYSAALVNVEEIRWGAADKRLAQCEWIACQTSSGKYETSATAAS